MIEELVSIVIPVYNCSDTICDTVSSVLNQTYKNMEIIIVDDCSTEDIIGKVQSLQDNRIRYYRNKKNMGANYSRNYGILHSKGRFIAFQDSADIWMQDKLEKQMAMFSDENIDAVYCETEYIKQDGTHKIVPDRWKDDKNRNECIYYTLLYTNIIDTPSLIVKKECLIECGMFDEDMPRLQDWELCLRLAKSYKFLCVNEILSKGRYRKDSISSDYKRLITAGSLLIKKNIKEMEEEKVVIYNIMNFFREALEESYGMITPQQLKAEFYNSYGKEFLQKYGITNVILEDMIKDFRFRKYYYVYSIILNKISSSENLTFDFSNKSVAIYGYGTLGKILYKQLIKENVNVKYVIDDDNRIEADVTVYRCSQIPENNLTDIVIVTPIYDFIKIKEKLELIGNQEVVSIETVFM
ncbi:MAG: glycosyltransferase [Lachnospiraceae bacterium]|nr:glycosyltransferase [Lachnospiraceae bacterium]